MVQMNQFAGQKSRHRCTEQTYGHQGGKAVGGLGMVVSQHCKWTKYLHIQVYMDRCLYLVILKNMNGVVNIGHLRMEWEG